MDALTVVGLGVMLAGGSVGFVIWWCWGRPQPEPPTCERCAVEGVSLYRIRVHSSTSPSYEMEVCAQCVDELRASELPRRRWAR